MLQQMFSIGNSEIKNKYLPIPDYSSFMLPIFRYLEQFYPIPKEFMTDHEKDCKLIHIKKNKYILSPMDNNGSIFFLVKGIVRGFIKDDNKDISTWFGFENEILGAFRHPNEENQHSIEYLQAVEDCELISIPYTLIDFLYDTYPEAGLIARKLLALHHHAASERAILARIPSALGRYNRLQNSKIDISRIPQRYLASYLGMRIETLSRIRSKSLHQHI